MAEKEDPAESDSHDALLASYQFSRASTLAAFYAERAAYMQTGAQYGVRALGALLTLNGGAVLGYVVFVNALRDGWAECFADLLACAFWLFVTGFGLALLSCVIAVVNNELQSHAAGERLEVSLRQLSLLAAPAFNLDREQEQELIDAANTRAEEVGKWLDRTFFASIVVGVLSFGAMLAAILTAAGMFAALGDPTICTKTQDMDKPAESATIPEDSSAE